MILNTFRQEYFLPSQETTYLGFIFRTTNILLSVTEDKKEKIKKAYISYLGKELLKTMELSSQETSYVPLEHWINVKQVHWKI